MSNLYESARLVSDYLFFHYATREESAGGMPVPREALEFPVRVVNELMDDSLEIRNALDIGCAVGRSTFELARRASHVLGVDFSRAFIDAANMMKREREMWCEVIVEGNQTRKYLVRVPEEINSANVRFEHSDAMNLRSDIGKYDLVLASNLICRLPDPRKFLARLPGLVAPGGALLLATPFSWLHEYTPEANWLGGQGRKGARSSWDTLREALEPYFELQLTKDLPFLIREHARKFQYGISLGSRWKRNGLGSPLSSGEHSMG